MVNDIGVTQFTFLEAESRVTWLNYASLSGLKPASRKVNCVTPIDYEVKGLKMVVKKIEVMAGEDLVVKQEILGTAGLGRYLQLIIQQGEIRILPEVASDPEKVLAELAGCLGQEPVTEYDFNLKVGSLYEAR